MYLIFPIQNTIPMILIFRLSVFKLHNQLVLLNHPQSIGSYNLKKTCHMSNKFLEVRRQHLSPLRRCCHMVPGMGIPLLAAPPDIAKPSDTDILVPLSLCEARARVSNRSSSHITVVGPSNCLEQCRVCSCWPSTDFRLAVWLALFITPSLRASRVTDGHVGMRVALVFGWLKGFGLQLIFPAVTFSIAQPIV